MVYFKIVEMLLIGKVIEIRFFILSCVIINFKSDFEFGIIYYVIFVILKIVKCFFR